jgi:hypothetical protein
MAGARAAASAFALQAAGLLTAATGARAVLHDEHAQRLVREATFLLVFGSRPTIKTALLDRLTAAALASERLDGFAGERLDGERLAGNRNG